MQYDKPSLDITQQVERLKGRGMIGDNRLMAERLSVVSYYRLTAYWHPFRNHNDQFRPGTQFETVWQRYVFDRHLRLHVLDAVERIEITVRTQLALKHSLHYSPFAYAEDKTSLPRLKDREHQRFQNTIIQEYERSEELFVKHFKNTYGDSHRYLPVWMGSEIMSFGGILTFYRGCIPSIRRDVARCFGVHHTVFESWMMTLNVIRNICAHHGRLWNRVLGVKPKIPDKDPVWHEPVLVTNDRTFAILTICKYCLNRIAPQSHWASRFYKLLERFDEIPQIEMGMPDNWQKCPIWVVT